MNFVGGVLDFKEKGIFYSDLEEIYKITRALSNRVTIRHDYVPYEFTLYLYKNNRATKNNIFKEFLQKSKMKYDDSLWLKSGKIREF